MSRKRANLSDLLNDLTFRTIFNKYKMVAMNAFEWSGLPEGIEEKHIERILFDYGKAIFFRDPNMSYMCLEAQDKGIMNVNYEPLQYMAVGNGYRQTYSHDDCIIIENNKLRKATRDFVFFYVNKITEAERTMDVNIKAVKTPIIFTCDDKDVLTFKRLFQQVDGNVPAHFVDKGLRLDSINCFDTKAQFLGVDLMNYKKSVENELLTFLGMNNLPTEKKERMITDEANSNNQLIDSFADLQLQSRQLACERINTKYGLNISVKRRSQAGGGSDVEHTDV